MSPQQSKTAIAIVFGAILVGSIFALGGSVAGQSSHQEDPQQTSYLRVVHASPDAPPVDVLVENESVLTDVPFGAVSDYLSLQAGSYNVTIAAAEDPDTVVFEGEVTLEPRTVTTVAASGEISEQAATDFEPVFLSDNAVTPGPNESAISIVHLSPDAPPVDVTTADGGVVLADNVSFQNASDYVTVPAGNYTVEVRAATEDNLGAIVTTVNVSLDGGTAYSAFAVGYLNTDVAPADTPFEVITSEDASMTIQLPSDETPVNETPVGTETPMNETPTGTETSTEG